jgi:hypothetical protein
MSARTELAEAVKEYKTWRARGGMRGTEMDRTKRTHISGLMERAANERAKEETITIDDETEHEINPFEEDHVRHAA